MATNKRKRAIAIIEVKKSINTKGLQNQLKKYARENIPIFIATENFFEYDKLMAILISNEALLYKPEKRFLTYINRFKDNNNLDPINPIKIY